MHGSAALTTGKACGNCSASFDIPADDSAFYAQLKIPEPAWCPPCREMRRMAWCNETSLYQRECAKCRKKVISEFEPHNPRIVYCIDCWWGDGWDPKQYGRAVDLSRPIMQQIHELELAIPHAAVNTDLQNENSEYTHYAGHEKNCYMMFHTSFAEDCYYGYGVKKAKSCIDNHYCHESELCYECTDVHGCYDLGFSQDCTNCSESEFLYDCIGCKHCLMCTGLRSKEYCILNVPVGKDEYEEKRKSLRNGSYAVQQAALRKFEELKLKHPRKALRMEMTEDSIGDHLYRARNATYCFDCSDVENGKYCSQLQLGTKQCYDIYQFGINIELCVDCSQIGYNCYNCQFGFEIIEQCSDLQYCISCHSTKSSFGCVGLKQSRFCILNKEYPEAEYRTLLPKVIERMKTDGEYGEFFPMALSPSGYNQTMAQGWYPMTEKDVKAKGWNWEKNMPFTKGQETVTSLPDAVGQTPESITKETLACVTCKRNYKIIPQEFKFYRENNYPLPRECFPCRRQRRLLQRTPRRFWDRSCARCKKSIKTTYAPERPEIVYCESCYLATVY